MQMVMVQMKTRCVSGCLRNSVIFLFGIAICSIPVSFILAANKSFVLMEALESKGNPSLEEFGFTHLVVVNPKKDLSFQGNDKKNMVTRESVVHVAKMAENADMICIDIESWPTCNTCRNRQRSLDRYLQVLDWYRTENSGPRLGFWGRPPKHDYDKAITSKDSVEYREWQKHNDFYKPLADEVDVIFPSLYAKYDNVQGWIKHAEENIAAARKYGKPVYPFLMPHFLPSDKPYSKKEFSYEFWKTQLETVYKLADGVVIWNGPARKWNPNNPWWKATRDFLAEKKFID